MLLTITKAFDQKRAICSFLQQADLQAVAASKNFADKKALQLTSQVCEVFTAASKHAEQNKFSISLPWL